MEITEVRIKLMEEPSERLRAFCSITFDNCFVIRDLKIIDGTNGPFVAMPSRKLTAHCPRCRCKNHLKASYCNQCGYKFEEIPELRDESGRNKLYADIAHPINSACREIIQDRVVKAFEEELEKSKLPGYVSSYDDYNDSGEEGTNDFNHEASPLAFNGNRNSTMPRKKKAEFGAGIFE
jgi:stage V sporulation protein G